MRGEAERQHDETQSAVAFTRFVGEEQLGQVVPNQVELTYVDPIVAGEGWASHSELDRVLTVFHNEFSDAFLGAAEGAELAVRFVMKDAQGSPVGRLHVLVQPVFRLRAYANTPAAL